MQAWSAQRVQGTKERQDMSAAAAVSCSPSVWGLKTLPPVLPAVPVHVGFQ